jgi:GTPase SAR1 family protein
LDPAAESFEDSDTRTPSKDIRDLVSVDDVMEELQYGPNGGLIFALEYMLENSEWLQEELGGQFNDEFLVVDCPGQIEIYTHFDIMPRIIEMFQRADYRVCAVYLLESQWMEDATKFFAGVLNATSAMLQLGIPHLNLMSKMDLCIDKHLPRPRAEMSPAELEEAEEEILDTGEETNPLHRYFFPDRAVLEEALNAGFEHRPRFKALNRALVQLVDEFDMVNFIPLNANSESSLTAILSHIDHATQYAEQLEPKEPRDHDNDNDDEYEHGSEEFGTQADYENGDEPYESLLETID